LTSEVQEKENRDTGEEMEEIAEEGVRVVR